MRLFWGFVLVATLWLVLAVAVAAVWLLTLFIAGQATP